jgi:hypothetical protein
MLQAPYNDPSPDRLEVRTTAGLKRKIQAAAELLQRSSTDLILDAADREATYVLAQAALAAQRLRPEQSIEPGEHIVFHVRERGSSAQWRNQHLLACGSGRYDLVGAVDQIGFGAWDTISVLRSFISPSGIYEAERSEEVARLIRRLGGDRTPEDAARFKKEVEQLFVDLGLADGDGGRIRILGGAGELHLISDVNTWFWMSAVAGGTASLDNLDPRRAVFQILRRMATGNGDAFGPADVQLDIPFATSSPPRLGLVRFTSHGNGLYTVIGSDGNNPARFADVDFATALTGLAGVPPMLLRARILDAIETLNKVLQHIPVGSP